MTTRRSFLTSLFRVSLSPSAGQRKRCQTLGTLGMPKTTKKLQLDQLPTFSRQRISALVATIHSDCVVVESESKLGLYHRGQPNSVLELTPQERAVLMHMQANQPIGAIAEAVSRECGISSEDSYQLTRSLVLRLVALGLAVPSNAV